MSDTEKEQDESYSSCGPDKHIGPLIYTGGFYWCVACNRTAPEPKELSVRMYTGWTPAYYEDEPEEESRCECGATAAGAPFHSDYCPLYKDRTRTNKGSE